MGPDVFAIHWLKLLNGVGRPTVLLKNWLEFR
jgi:hypothetical protein